MTAAVPGAGERIVRVVTSWAGVTTGVGEYGETEFFVHGRMIGHVHGGELADIPFPRSARDELVAAGRTAPHHIHPNSGWTSRFIRGVEDIDAATALLRINYDRVTSARDRRL